MTHCGHSFGMMGQLIQWEARTSLKAGKLSSKECAMTLLLLIIGSLVFIVLLSFGVEALRQRPTAPATLYWAPEIPIQTTEICGNAIRYIKTGRGPPLVLLHTLRTQLDIFEKLVPLL